VTSSHPGYLHVEHAGSGERLVLLHGFTQTSRCWGPFADDLATDHELVLVDLPGHGGSSEVEADLVQTAGLAADAGGRGTWIGYSMGGRVALHAALLRPAVVDRLVLIGATGGIDDEDERDARRASDEALADRIETVGVEAFIDEWLAQPLFAGLDADAAARDERLHNTVAGLASSLRRCGTGMQEPLWSRLSAIAVPTLVVVGELDAKFTELGQRLVSSIGINASMATIPDAGHSTHLESSGATAAAVRRWLADQPPMKRPTDSRTPNTSWT
jgi:2-succinyl-6-hydroxy-2,4-cyclohexadiene-1-carboxylate synthase